MSSVAAKIAQESRKENNVILLRREGVFFLCYDLMGRKLSAPQRGVNIINGNKVIVK